MRNTNLVIFSGPSGAGKDAVIQGLIKKGLPLELVKTSITRAMRPGEVEGRIHYFISSEEMTKKIESGEMAEWAYVYGNIYGVTKEELKRVQGEKEKIGIWRMDEQGARAARQIYPDILAIGIVAPKEELEKRAARRGDEEKEIKQRMASQKEWTGDEKIFDYKVENKEGKLEEAVDEVISILEKEGCIRK